MSAHSLRRWPNSKPTLRERLMSAGSIVSQQTHFYNICTMLDQRRRRWADVVQML